MNEYVFKLTNEIDNYKDFNIYFLDQHVGILQYVDNETEFFIRQIRIFETYRRQHHAQNIMNILLKNNNIKLCIAAYSESAVCFWQNYFVGKNVENIRGEIYLISKCD